MDQERNLRSAWVTAIRRLAPLLWMLVLTNSTTQSMMCEGLFLDVTKISEPEGNEARARLGGSSASGPFSADAPSLPLPLRLSLVQFEKCLTLRCDFCKPDFGANLANLFVQSINACTPCTFRRKPCHRIEQHPGMFVALLHPLLIGCTQDDGA